MQCLLHFSRTAIPRFLSCAVISSLRLPGRSQFADRSAYWLSEIHFVGVVGAGVFAGANGLI